MARGIVARQARGVDVRDRVSDGAQILHPHRRPRLLVVADDDGRVVRSLEDLVVVVDLPAMFAVVEAALGTIGVCVGERSTDCIETHAVVAELHGVQLNANGGLGAAADKHLSDALDLRDLLRQDRVRHVVDLRLRNHVRGQRKNQDWRLSWVGLAIAGILRQVRRATGCEPR